MLLIYLFFNLYVRRRCASFAQKSPHPSSQIRLMNGRDQYAPERALGGFPESAPFPNTCANSWVLRSTSSHASASPSVDEPEVRRVGFASFALLPPSRTRAPLPLWCEGSSGSGGGLRAMLEKSKFVPMARPYASDILIF